MLASKLVSVIAFAFLCAAQLSAAKHSSCSWQPNRNQPARNGYFHFCSAKAIRANGKPAAIYTCEPGSEGAENVEVANFGLTIAGALEIETPCGTGGYALDEDSECPGQPWAACLGHVSSGECYYLYNEDDCTWRGPAARSTPRG